jgi:glycosyltransferase involved in cell wall biosynthesis
MKSRVISIVVPCYNESKTLETIIARVLVADVSGLEREVIIVDDGSQDDSVNIAKSLAERYPNIRVLEHKMNQGKGAALRTGFQAATGEIILVQDADLEYNPSDYPKLLAPILDDRADVVYGSRFRSGSEMRVLLFWHNVGNSVLTLMSNMMTNLNLTDMETCYKVFRREVIQAITIQEDRFGFEVEITAKIARLPVKPRIYEVGISYSGRTYSEGKKITWKDGIRAVWCIFRYNI